MFGFAKRQTKTINTKSLAACRDILWVFFVFLLLGLLVKVSKLACITAENRRFFHK